MANTQATAEMLTIDQRHKQLYDNIKWTSRELDQYLTSETIETEEILTIQKRVGSSCDQSLGKHQKKEGGTT